MFGEPQQALAVQAFDDSRSSKWLTSSDGPEAGRTC